MLGICEAHFTADKKIYIIADIFYSINGNFKFMGFEQDKELL